MTAESGPIVRQIFTVSKLTAEIKTLLEDRFPFVWLTGEISNFSRPSSGHYYFTLKDPDAQIRAVMFRGQNRNLPFVPEDGMAVTGLGRLSLYEPRGTYQIIFEHLEPKGVGALQVAFEQLRNRLAEEGLFDDGYKKPLPYLPRHISVITSSTGAVIHDILRVTYRRYPDMILEIVPIRVQGDRATDDIVAALDLVNRRKHSDIIILARGGGSLEDLQAFNTEPVARAIFASNIPVISAIGHETDFTIADFVADLRAPTPSAAAEMAVPVKVELRQMCDRLQGDLSRSILFQIDDNRERMIGLTGRLVHPKRRIDELKLRIDDFSERLDRMVHLSLSRHRERFLWQARRLRENRFQTGLSLIKEKLYKFSYNLKIYMQLMTDNNNNKTAHLFSRLTALNPEAVLARGYSITRMLPNNRVVRTASQVSAGQNIEILLARGRLTARVERADEPDTP